MGPRTQTISISQTCSRSHSPTHSFNALSRTQISELSLPMEIPRTRTSEFHELDYPNLTNSLSRTNSMIPISQTHSHELNYLCAQVFGKSLLMEFFTNGALDGAKLATLIDAGLFSSAHVSFWVSFCYRYRSLLMSLFINIRLFCRSLFMCIFHDRCSRRRQTRHTHWCRSLFKYILLFFGSLFVTDTCLF